MYILYTLFSVMIAYLHAYFIVYFNTCCVCFLMCSFDCKYFWSNPNFLCQFSESCKKKKRTSSNFSEPRLFCPAGQKYL